MALSLKDPEVDRLAREVASLTGESLTDAVKGALRQRLKEEARRREDRDRRYDRLMAIAREIHRHPITDGRSADDILGFNENGHFDDR
jgi:antitoxin VapB